MNKLTHMSTTKKRIFWLRQNWPIFLVCEGDRLRLERAWSCERGRACEPAQMLLFRQVWRTFCIYAKMCAKPIRARDRQGANTLRCVLPTYNKCVSEANTI